MASATRACFPAQGTHCRGDVEASPVTVEGSSASANRRPGVGTPGIHLREVLREVFHGSLGLEALARRLSRQEGRRARTSRRYGMEW
jgi:hypothetical protein